MPAERRTLLPPPAPKDWLRIYKICVVCLGNICRSPMAQVLIEGELRAADLSDRVSVQSAGTGDWHLGEPMDRGARAELARHGYDGSPHRARQISQDWLGRFDLIIAMDHNNMRSLERLAARCPDRAEVADRIRLFRSFDPAAPPGAQVPDPYGGGPDDFAEVFDMMRAAAIGLAGALAELLARPSA